MPLLFSYGTLQEPRVQLATFGRLLEGRPDALAGHELAQVPIPDPAEAEWAGRTHYDTIRSSEDESSRVAGTVFELTGEELAASDEYEAGADYGRKAMTLVSGTEAWVYAHRGDGGRS
jgi:gamma-glutamylcyclotransferase (GGCT)/AIG2-like uncharacterized protein YtfP